MQGYQQEPHYARPYVSGSPQLHAGAQKFMTGVYGWMSVGILVTAAAAFAVSMNGPLLQALYFSPLKWVMLFAPVVVAVIVQRMITNMSRGGALAAFLGYAALLGAGWMAPLAYVVAQGGGAALTILGILGATAGMYAVLAVIGFTTKKDFSGIGQFLVMALFGAVIASIINVFLGLSGLGFAIAVIVALVSAGLTVYYTQTIKQLYMVHGDRGNLAILGALVLYINFINLFLSLLRLFGGGRE